MKNRYFVTTLVFLISSSLFSQEIDKCRHIINNTIEAINLSDFGLIEDDISSDFSINDYKGQTALAILKQIIVGLNQQAKLIKEINSHNKGKRLHISAEIAYDKLGKKVASFTFGPDNKILGLELFKITVKKPNLEYDFIIPGQDKIEIPIDFIGKLPQVKVYLNGKESIFLVDSGSPITILNSIHLTKTEGSINSISSTSGVSGSISNTDVHQIELLDFYGISLKNTEMLTMDLSHIEAEIQTSIHGLIGQDLLTRFDVLFDYHNQIICLTNPNIHDLEYGNTEQIKKTLEFQKARHIPVLKINVNSKELKLGLDSGAESNLLDTSMFSELNSKLMDVREELLVGADGREKITLKGNLKGIKIDDIEFPKMETLFADISHLQKASETRIDGLLGYPFFNHYKVLISYSRNRIYLIR